MLLNLRGILFAEWIFFLKLCWKLISKMALFSDVLFTSVNYFNAIAH